MAEIDVRKPEPLWFGRDRARCFGMLHEPAMPATRGVIFCNALAFDGLLAYRAFHHLADDLTARGFWALRFDYDGEGDSAGGPWEPARVDAWLESIDAAVGVLRARGVTDVRLVGFRIGATFACRYATTHPGISGMALWSPLTRGSAYVRELRALSRLSTAARPPQHLTAERFPSDSLELAGFEFAAPTLKDLSAIDLVKAPGSVRVPSVLLIDRIDAPPSDGLVTELTTSGSQVEHERMSGYEEFLTDDEVTSVIPWPILHRIEDWLDEITVSAPNVSAESVSAEDVSKEHVSGEDASGTSATSGGAPSTDAARRRPVVESTTLAVDEPGADRFSPRGPDSSRVVDEPVWIDGRLFAMRSSPACGAPVRRASIVLCNAGTSTRIGPGRLYVTLARYWASLGFTVLRVDLGGTGDSIHADPATENKPHAPIRVEELHATVNWLRRRTGFDQVVVAGVCSGAFNAFHAAIEGLDVDHLMLVNPGLFYLGANQDPFSADEHALNMAYTFARSVVNVRRWKLALRDRQVLMGGLRNARGMIRGSAADGFRVLIVSSARKAGRRISGRAEPPSDLSRDLDAIVRRGVKVLFVFAAGESAARYLRKFGGPACQELFDGDNLRLVESDGGDHIFSSPGSRQWLFEVTTNYLEREYVMPLGFLPADGDRQASDGRG